MLTVFRAIDQTTEAKALLKTVQVVPEIYKRTPATVEVAVRLELEAVRAETTTVVRYCWKSSVTERTEICISVQGITKALVGTQTEIRSRQSERSAKIDST